MIREMNREMQELKADMREMREMNREVREMIREMNRELKADMREMNRGMREMQELKADIREMNREIREMQELKADIRVMKKCIQRLSRSASADWNVNASSLDHQIKKSEEVEFQLLFANKLPDKIFTRDKIRDESDGSVQIKLIDTISRETVELDPLSSMEIEIVVLDGDFGYEGNENWTEQEFNAKIVQQRKSKGPLVKGKQNITLKKGVGIINDLSFSDNSSWKDCGKFRLGARVLQSRSRDQARIKEAISQAFVVNDFRMRVYHEKRSKKLDLPSLDNDVSPLKKIKKNAKCHTDNNILTVRDFKEMHGTDHNKQTEILKDCSDSDLEVTVQDASCVVDDEKLNASSNPILRQTTDPPPHYEFTAPYQGFTGMQNANNHASSSHDHRGGFSTAEEIDPNLASQPLDTSTGYPVNAQGVKSNSNFDPSSSQYMSDEIWQDIVQNDVYGDLERNSSQLNEISNFLPSRNSYITAEDSQINKRQNTVMTDPFWNEINLPNLQES